MPGLISRRRPLPKPSPESDPRFKKVMEDLKRGAARTKHHAPAARKAAEASAAAKGPPNEKLAAGKSAQVDKIQGAPTKNPEPTSFLAVLQAEIAKAMPKTLSDTEKFMKGGRSEELKGSLKGNVSKQKDEAAGGVKGASTEAPKEAGTAKKSEPIPGEPAPATSRGGWRGGHARAQVRRGHFPARLETGHRATDEKCGRHRAATPKGERSAIQRRPHQPKTRSPSKPTPDRRSTAPVKKERCRGRRHKPKEWRARATQPWST